MEINTKDIRRLERTLTGMSKHGVKFATMFAMNGAAFEARQLAVRNVEKKFITRNAWTKRSIRVNKGNTRDLRASVGSTEDYMRKQELGGSERAGGRKGVAIATSYSSGEGENARPRRKLSRRPNRIRNITLKNTTGRARGRKARNVAKVKEAAKGSNKVVYLDGLTGKKKRGLFRITGGKRRPKVKMIQDMSQKKVRTRKKPWLGPATRTAAKGIPRRYKKSLLMQIDKAALRNGLVMR